MPATVAANPPLGGRGRDHRRSALWKKQYRTDKETDRADERADVGKGQADQLSVRRYVGSDGGHAKGDRAHEVEQSDPPGDVIGSPGKTTVTDLGPGKPTRDQETDRPERVWSPDGVV